MKRGFVDTSFGQVHYRYAGDARSGARPLVMLHGSPYSSKSLETLGLRFAATRQVFAPDTLGNGNSAPPPLDGSADMALLARAHMEAIEALGFETFDLYGSHTGANLAIEIAIARSGRVGRLILDGVSIYSEDERADLLAHYAPPLEVTSDGRHILWLWQFLRDTHLFWPWYKQGAANLRGGGLASPERLHDTFVEVVKAARTYRISYNAAFAYRKEERLPLVNTPTLVACAQTDMLLPYQDQVASLLPRATKLVTPTRLSDVPDETFARLVAFLDGVSPDSGAEAARIPAPSPA